MANDFSRLEAEVTENSSVIDSAVTLLEGLATQLRQFADDPAKINALADSLDSQSNRLAQAVAANTPAETGGGTTGGGETGGGTGETGGGETGGTGGGESTPPSFR